jgi:hypothetical protein
VSGASTECNPHPFIRWRGLVVACATLTLGGCLGGRGSLDGKVIDVWGGEVPVSGAIVVLKRSRAANVATDATTCEGQQLTYTDEQGRFHLDRWSPPTHSVWNVIFPSNYFMELVVYKRMLGETELLINGEYRGVVKLHTKSISREALLIHIHSAAEALACNGYQASMKPVVDALKSDAAEIATTPQELNDAVGVLNPIAYPAHITPREPAQTTIQSPPTPNQSGASPQ